MKKFLTIAAAAIMMISCGDDDSESTGTSVNGTWKLTAFELDQDVDFNEDGTSSSDLIAESGCYDNSNIVFNNSNVATFNFQELDIELDLVIGTENTYEYTIDCLPSTPEVAAYTVSGNNVNVTFDYGDGETDTMVLVKSGNTMSVTIPEFTYVPEEGNDGEVSYTFVGATLVFTKQ